MASLQLTVGDQATFVDLCIDLSASDKKTILKKILQQKYSRVREIEPGLGASASTDLPTSSHELLRMDPSPDEFVEYTYSLCSFENELSREEILKVTLTKALEGIMGKEKRESPRKTADGAKKRRKSRRLPAKLSPFVTYEGTESEETLRSMDRIVEEFFPEIGFVFPCVYADSARENFVLLIPDRHVNKWKAAGSQCTFVWRTSEQDVNTDIFIKVINAVPRVHVVRERKRELVYMGKCTKVDDVNSSGTCTMFVS